MSVGEYYWDKNDNGELKLFVDIDDYVDALYCFIQALLRISNILYYTPKIVLHYEDDSQ